MTVRKVISGFQTGADIGGILGATRLGLLTGGWIPKGYLTEDGPRPEYIGMYGAQEHPSPKYPPRTRDNVLDADGTLIIGREKEAGTALTILLCKTLERPHFVVRYHWGDPFRPEDVRDLDIERVKNWIVANNIHILNIAGNRESINPGIKEFTSKFLEEVLSDE